MNEKKFIIIIFILAFILRVGFILIAGERLLPVEGLDPYYYDKIATGIVQGEGYHQGNLLAYMPPLYPFFLAWIYFVFSHSYLAVQVIQSVLSSLTVIWIYLIGKNIFSQRVGIIAAIFFTFYLQFIRYPGELFSETLFIFLFYAAIYFLLKKPRSSLNEIAAGIFAGLAALTREIALIVFPLTIFFWQIFKQEKAKTVVTSFLRVAVPLMLIIFPWSLRNYLIFHRFIPISTNPAINFYLGNNPNATGEFKWELPAGISWNQPSEKKGEYELEWYKKGISEGIKYIKSDLGGFLKLALKKGFILWRPPYYEFDPQKDKLEFAFRTVWLGSYMFILIGTICGMSLTRIRWRELSFLYLLLIFPTLIIMATISSSRYRLPYIPILFFFSAFWVETLVQKFFRKNSENISGGANL